MASCTCELYEHTSFHNHDLVIKLATEHDTDNNPKATVTVTVHVTKVILHIIRVIVCALWLLISNSIVNVSENQHKITEIVNVSITMANIPRIAESTVNLSALARMDKI